MHRRDPGRGRAVELAEDEDVEVVEMLHRAGGVERGRDHAETAEHPLGAEALLQGVEVAETVQERQDRGLRPDRGRERGHRFGQVVGLAGDDDDVEGRVQVFLEHERRRGQGRIAEAALDHEAGASQGLGPAGAQQEGDVASGLEQPAAEIAAEGPRPHDQITHVLLRCFPGEQM